MDIAKLKYDVAKVSTYTQANVGGTLFTDKHRELLMMSGEGFVPPLDPLFVQCSHCTAQLKNKDFRTHLAHHLLQVEGYRDSSANSVKVVYCGFCGKDETEMCRPTLTSSKVNLHPTDYTVEHGMPVLKKGYMLTITTQCPVAKHVNVSTQYKSMMKFSASNPSTNAPRSCFVTGCESHVWMYSMAAHYSKVHPDAPETAMLTGIMHFILDYTASTEGQHAVALEKLETLMAPLVGMYSDDHDLIAICKHLMKQKYFFNRLAAKDTKKKRKRGKNKKK